LNAGNWHGAERAGNKSDGFKSEPRMIDGEVVVPATNGTSDFSVLQENRAGSRISSDPSNKSYDHENTEGSSGGEHTRHSDPRRSLSKV
jgi:hypothetical protein